MKPYFNIAKRYIFAKRSFNFITVITTISIIGIIVGVAALICVTSIFNAFRELTEEQLMGFDPHLQILPADGAYLSFDDTLLNLLENNSDIVSYVPVISGRIIGFSNSNMQVFNINAYPPEYSEYINTLSNSLYLGNINLNIDNNIILGAALADKLRVLPMDTIQVLSPAIIESSIRTFRKKSEINAEVGGIFRTNIKDYDANLAILPTTLASQLLNIPLDNFSSIDIKVNSPKKINEIKNQLAKQLPDNVKLLTWIDLNKDLYAIMQFERLASSLILSIIILMAVFNILASLTMTVVEKTRDIGGLKAIGASEKFIYKIFISEGFLIGLFGTIFGTMLGLFLAFGQKYFKWFKLDQTKFIIDAIPVSIYFIDVLLIIIFVMTFSTIAALYPAHRASNIKIADAVRSE